MRQLITLMCLLLSSVALQAQVVVSGTVTDGADGQGLAGASVYERGTSNGTLTDANGAYTITVDDESSVLVFKFVGYASMEKPATSRNISVSLETDDLLLDEVVVTALGIKREKKQLGYAVQSVGGGDVVSSGETNAIAGLNAKVAGVQVIASSGSPGAAAFIRIRGSSSLTGNNQPLIVVDGVPIDNSQNRSGNPDDGNNNLLAGVANSNRGIDINPADIENVTVLKGPAASALYGIQAANGAVLITTKRGSSTPGKNVSISYNTSLALDRVNQFVPLQDEYAQGVSGTYFPANRATPSFFQATSFGPKIDTLAYNGIQNEWFRDGDIVSANDPTAQSAVSPFNNQEQFFRTGKTWNNNLSLSGGNVDNNYRFSLSNTKQTGVVPNSEFNRTTVRLSGDTKLSKRLKTAASVAYTNSGGTRVQQGSNTSGLMLGLLRTTPTFDNSYGNDDPEATSAYILADGTQRNYRGGGGYDNPYWTINQSPFVDDVNRVLGYTSVSYDATKWLNIFYRIGTDVYSDERQQVFAINSRTLPAGQIYEEKYNFRQLNSDLWITATRQFNEKLNGSLLLGNNIFDRQINYLYTQGDGFTIPGFAHMSNAQSVLTRQTTTNKRTAAVFANAKLAYDDYLFLDLTARNEWSSTLPVGDNSFFYPSASLGFVFSEPLGLSDNKIFPYGKLRFSYASVGNDAPSYSTLTYFGSSSIGDGWTNGLAFPINGVSAFTYDDVLGNPALRPEKTNSIEVGADLRFLSNRIGIDFTYYKQTSVDQILAVPIAASAGALSLISNAGKVENSGIEIVLTATPVKTKDLRWDIIANFTKNRNWVVELPEGVETVFLGGFSGTSVRNVPDAPYGQIFGGTFLRDDNGNMVIEDDVNSPFYGFPIASGEEEVIGDPNPDFLANLRNTLTYKGLSFSFLFDFRKGGDIWNGTQGALTFFGMSELTENRGTTQIFEGVKGTVDGDGNLVSSGAANDIEATLGEDWYLDNGGGFGVVAEHFVQEANWVRLREITLAYTMPSSWFEKTPIAGLNVGVSGRNLLLFTGYEGIDPETNLQGAINAQGLDYFNMPNTKGFSFRVGVDF